jgi:uncharacterized protein (TIGR00369 family)
MPDDSADFAASNVGFLAYLGARKTAFEDGYARFELTLAGNHLNPHGIPHGGVYATLLDTTLGSAGCWDGRPDRYRPAVTLNLNVSFVDRPRGTHLICEGRRVGGGKSVFFSEGSIQDDTGRVVARATGTFKLLDRSRG